MNSDLMLGMVLAAVSASVLAYLLVKTVFATAENSSGPANGGSVRVLLAIPGVLVERQRGKDKSLDRELQDIERLRVQAGCRFLEGATAAEIFVARFVFPLVTAAVVLPVGALLKLGFGTVMLVTVGFGAMLYLWPRSALKSAAELRSARFVADLPTVLDVMRLVSQSGGDLYSSIRNAISVTPPSPVREELIRLTNEVAIGISLSAALNNVGERVNAPDANAVFSTLAQSLEMGTSVSDNLQSAAGLIRHSQRMKAQMQAQKAVVAMSFPLLLLILPGVFVVLFAPLIIQYMNMNH